MRNDDDDRDEELNYHTIFHHGQLPPNRATTARSRKRKLRKVTKRTGSREPDARFNLRTEGQSGPDRLSTNRDISIIEPGCGLFYFRSHNICCPRDFRPFFLPRYINRRIKARTLSLSSSRRDYLGSRKTFQTPCMRCAFQEGLFLKKRPISATWRLPFVSWGPTFSL